MGALGDAAHLTRNLVAIHLGHHEIAKHEVGAPLANLLQPLLTVFCHIHPSTEMDQQHPREFAMIGMVLHDQDGHAFQGHGSGDYRAQHASTGARTCPAQGIRVRASQNTIPHDSHQCCDVIVPFPAMRWPARLMCSLWQVGHRRSWVTGNSELRRHGRRNSDVDIHDGPPKQWLSPVGLCTSHLHGGKTYAARMCLIVRTRSARHGSNYFWATQETSRQPRVTDASPLGFAGSSHRPARSARGRSQAVEGPVGAPSPRP